MYVLSKFAERYQAPTYSGLIRKALGRKLSASEPQASLMLSSRMVMSLRSSVPHEPLQPVKVAQSSKGCPVRCQMVMCLHSLFCAGAYVAVQACL